MSKSSFHSIHEIERLLDREPEALKEIVFELRNLVAEIAPYATEKILWGGLSYYDAKRGGTVKGGICQIEVHAEVIFGDLNRPMSQIQRNLLNRRPTFVREFGIGSAQVVWG